MPAGTTVDALNIAMTLIVLVLAPLALGLLIRARWPEQAKEWAPEANKISTLMLLLVIGLMIVTSWQSIVSIFGAWVIACGVIAIAILDGCRLFLRWQGSRWHGAPSPP